MGRRLEDFRWGYMDTGLSTVWRFSQKGNFMPVKSHGSQVIANALWAARAYHATAVTADNQLLLVGGGSCLGPWNTSLCVGYNWVR